MHADEPNIYQAALLIASVDRRTADALLAQMSSREAAAVRRAVVELDDVDIEEGEAAIRQFARLAAQGQSLATTKRAEEFHGDTRRLVPSRHRPGIELNSAAVERLAPPVDGDAPESASARTSAPGAPGSFGSLKQIDPEELAEFLSRENSQTIAVVFAHLAPEQASAVLARLPMRLQTEVVRRLSHLDAVDDAVVRQIEQGFESWLSEAMRRSRWRGAGLSAVREILAATEQGPRGHLIAELVRHDAPLAQQLGLELPTPLDFEQLLQLDEAAIGAIFTRVDRQVALLALGGVDKQDAARVLRCLEPGEARRLRHALGNPEPMRISDVETSQQECVAVAAELQAQGLIDLAGIRERSVAA